MNSGLPLKLTVLTTYFIGVLTKLHPIRQKFHKGKSDNHLYILLSPSTLSRMWFVKLPESIVVFSLIPNIAPRETPEMPYVP